MRIALFPVMKRDAFSKKEFIVQGLDYFTAFDLTPIAGYLSHMNPGYQVVLEIDATNLLKRSPDLVVLWCGSSGFGQALALADMLKHQLGIPIILGGPHITNYPHSLPATVDIGVLGEAEISLGELIPIFAKDPHANPMKYGRVAGIVYQNRGRIFMGPTPKIIKDIDKLPMPRHDLFFDLPNSYWAPVIMTSRGACQLEVAPYAYTLQTSKVVRFHSPERVIAEMKAIAALYAKRYDGYSFIPLKHVSPVVIGDYLFLSQPDRIEKIVHLAKAAGIPEQLQFIVVGHYTDINERVCQLLTELNVAAVTLYFETFSAAFAKGRNRPYTPRQLNLALQACQRYGLAVTGCYQVNTSVEETRRDIFRTYWFLKSHQELFYQCQPVYISPFPGSAQWNQWLQTLPHKQIDPTQFSWEGMDFDFHEHMPFINHHVSKADFSKIFSTIKTLCGKIIPSRRYSIGFKSNQQHSAQHTFIRLEHLFPPKTERILDICHLNILCLRHAAYATKYEICHAPICQNRLPPIEGLYDVALVYNGLERVRDPISFLETLHGCLRPDGRLVMSLVNPRSIGFFLLLLASDNCMAFEHNLKFYSEQTIIPILEQTGFELTHVDYNIMNIEPYRNVINGLVSLAQNMAGIEVREEQFHILELIIVASRKDSHVRSIPPADAGKTKDPH